LGLLLPGSRLLVAGVSSTAHSSAAGGELAGEQVGLGQGLPVVRVPDDPRVDVYADATELVGELIGLHPVRVQRDGVALALLEVPAPVANLEGQQ